MGHLKIPSQSSAESKPPPTAETAAPTPPVSTPAPRTTESASRPDSALDHGSFSTFSNQVHRHEYQIRTFPNVIRRERKRWRRIARLVIFRRHLRHDVGSVDNQPRHMNIHVHRDCH